jgi:hypothetical protein
MIRIFIFNATTTHIYIPASLTQLERKHQMKLKIISCAAAVGMALCPICNVSAQDSHWNGTVNNTAWNVATNWNPVGVPPPGNPTTTYQGNVWLDPSPVDGDNVITITPGDVESPGVGNSSEVYNTIFGPEFGCTLNVYGTLTFDWTIAPYQPDPTPGVRSHINMFGNSYMYTTGASLNLGSGWWPVCEGAYVTMNLYSNANYSSLGGAGGWIGGHLNIYDTSSVLLNGYVNIDNGQANNDGTTVFAVDGGTLRLPEGFINTTVTNWIERGIIRIYGKGYDTNDVSITDNGTNTIITPVPLGGALQRVYFQPLVLSNLTVGDFEQVTLAGDYPSVGGVLLSSSEPGLSPGSFTHPTYSSSNPSVATIDANGLVTAVGSGSAMLTAMVGLSMATNSVVINVSPAGGTLIHRYSFASDASDSVGSANGSLNGDATVSGGQLVLDGTQGSSVSLPAGILSGLNEVTIEAWATFPPALNPYANLCAFGNTDFNGAGENYITFCPHTGTTTAQANFGQGDPGSSGERDAVQNSVYDGMTNLQIVIVYHPEAGYEAFYMNGVQCASISMFNILIDPVAYTDPAFTNTSILAYTLGADPVNYIGQSLYNTDPGLQANIDEFRIYNGALTPSQIAADNALGPNQLIGTSTAPVTLAVKSSGSNVTFSWPTTSAEVTLLASPKLGPGATWTAVTIPGGAMKASGGNYQVTLPASGSAEFFRLSK